MSKKNPSKPPTKSKAGRKAKPHKPPLEWVEPKPTTQASPAAHDAKMDEVRLEYSIGLNSPPDPVLREKLLAIDDDERNQSIEDRIAAKQRLIDEAFAAFVENTAQELSLPPPAPISYSTNKASSPSDPPMRGATLTGGGDPVDEHKLLRALATLFDMMSELSRGFPQAKPDCVHEYANRFIKLMDDFCEERELAAKLVTAVQMIPAVTTILRRWMNDWPTPPTLLDGDDRIPKKPSSHEERELGRQRQDLLDIAKSLCLPADMPYVMRKIEACLASSLFFKANSSRGLRWEAANILARLMNLPVGDSSLIHWGGRHSHIEKLAHQANWKFLIPPSVASLGAFDVLTAESAARFARSAYFRYLIHEEMKRDPNADGVLLAAERLGIHPLALDPSPDFITAEELHLWREPSTLTRIDFNHQLHLTSQHRPFRFQAPQSDSSHQGLECAQRRRSRLQKTSHSKLKRSPLHRPTSSR